MNIINKLKNLFYKFKLQNIYMYFNNTDLEEKIKRLDIKDITDNPLSVLCNHPFYSIVDISFSNKKVIISLESIVSLTILHDCIQTIYNRTSDYMFSFDIHKSYKVNKLVIDVEIEFSTLTKAYKYLILLLTDLNLELIKDVIIEPSNEIERKDFVNYFTLIKENFIWYINVLSTMNKQYDFIKKILINTISMIDTFLILSLQEERKPL